jgi:hypothetical protein
VKLAVAALVRNEIDIIGAFLQHLDALFDYALLMDHHSIDGTDRAIAAACARRAGWTMWHIDAVGYHQSAFSSIAVAHLMQNTDADAVMLLDADEFINVPDRASLVAAFSQLTDPDSVGSLGWLNAVPARLDTRTICAGDAIWLPAAAGRLGKAVIPRVYHARHAREARLGLGNHALYYEPATVVPSIPVGQIIHLPIRSYTQIKSKVLAGVFAVMMQASQQPMQCWHWYDILYRIGAGTLRDEDLIGMAVHYSVKDSQTSNPVAWADLPASGYARARLNVAFGPAQPAVTDQLTIDPTQLVATILRRFQLENLQTHKLVLQGDRLCCVPKEQTT